MGGATLTFDLEDPTSTEALPVGAGEQPEPPEKPLMLLRVAACLDPVGQRGEVSCTGRVALGKRVGQTLDWLTDVLPGWIQVTAVADGSRDQVHVGVALTLWRRPAAAATLGLLLQLEAALGHATDQALDEVVVLSPIQELEGASSAPGHRTVERTLEWIDGAEVGPHGVEALVLVPLVLAGGVRHGLLPLGKHLGKGVVLHFTGLGASVQALQVHDGQLR